MFKKFKAPLIVLLAGLSILTASAVFALELDYPKVPGVAPLDSANSNIAQYAKYLLNISFYITAGVCVIIIVIGGILYLIGRQTVPGALRAREYIKRGALGLLIIVTSSLMLYTINPELSIFNLLLPKVDIPPAVAILPNYGPKQAVFQEVPALQILAGALNHLGEKVYLDQNDRYIDENGYLTDGWGNFVNEQGDYVTAPQKGKLAMNFLPPTVNYLLGRPVLAQNNQNQEYRYAAEIPFIEVEGLIEEALAILEDSPTGQPGLNTLLQECQCGQSFYYMDFTATEGALCLPGKSPSDILSLDTYFKQQDKPSVFSKENVCQIGCDNCGQKTDSKGLICETHNVKETQVPVVLGLAAPGETIPTATVYQVQIYDPLSQQDKISKDPCEGWRYFDWEKPSWLLTNYPNWQPSLILKKCQKANGATEDASLKAIDKIVVDRLLKFPILKLQKVLAKLEVLKERFFPEQLSLLAKTLTQNKADFLLQENWGGLFNYDFLEEKTLIENQGFEVVVEPFSGSAGETITSGQTVLEKNVGSKGFFSWLFPRATAIKSDYLGYQSGSLFFLIHAPEGLVSQTLVDHNQRALYESSRASLFAVLTDLSLEKIEEFFKECLTAAFGNADYFLNKEELAKVLEQAINQGAASRFEAELDKLLDQAFLDITEQAKKAAEDGIKKEYVAKCFAPCKTAGSCTADRQNNILADLEKCSWTDSCCVCVRKCLEDNIPPHFVSDKVSALLSIGLEDVFKSVKTTLHTKIRYILFPEGGDINKLLNTQLVDIYDKVLQGALVKKNIAQLIPGLEDLLKTPTEEALPSLVSKNLSKVDEFLACTIDGCCYDHQPATCYQVKAITDCKAGEIFQRTAGQIECCQRVTKQDDCSANQIYQETAGKKQCCVEGIKKWVKRHSEDYLKGLVRQYVEEPIHDWAQGKIADWGLSSEYITLPECYLELSNGRIFVVAQGATGPFPSAEEVPGICKKMTPEEINNLHNVDIPVGIASGNINIITGNVQAGQVYSERIKAGQRQEICRGAGYEWLCNWKVKDKSIFDGFEETSDCACFDRNSLTQDISGALAAENKVAKVGKAIGAGAITWAEQFFIALIETTTHTAIEYAKVLIDDRIVFPFKATFGNVINFQKGLHSFLTSTVQQNLPSQMSQALNNNIVGEIDLICQQLNPQIKSKCPAEDSPIEEQTNVNLIFKLDLPGGNLTWKEQTYISANVDINCSNARFFCWHFAESLHHTLWQEFAIKFDEVAQVLSNDIFYYLNQVKIKLGDNEKTLAEWLQTPLAELVWDNLSGVLEIVKGTPKQLLCGELPVIKVANNGKVMVDTGNKQSIKDKCGAWKKTIWGLMPTVDQDKIKASVTEQGGRDILIPWCHFIYSACQNPLADGTGRFGLNKKAGDIVKDLANTACLAVSAKKQKDEGSACPASQNKARLLTNPWYKFGCSGCNAFVKDKIGKTLFYWAIEGYKISPTIVSLPKSEQKAKIKIVYQWLYQVFKTQPLASDILALATDDNLQFSQLEIAEIKQPASPISQQNQTVQGFLLWMSSNLKPGSNQISSLTMREAILLIPLGVVKPFKSGEDTLLVENSRETQNFLGRSTSQLTSLVCGLVNKQFAQDFPQYTMSALLSADLAKLNNVLPYSVESVQVSSIAKRLEIIASLPVEVISDPALQQAYLFCQALPLSPAQIFGLDQPLVNYLPAEWRILFKLFNEQLRAGQPSDCRADEFFWTDRFKINTKCCRAVCKAVKINENCPSGFPTEIPLEPTHPLAGLPPDIPASHRYCCPEPACHLAGQRPESLNQLLYYLFKTTPSGVLDILNGSPCPAKLPASQDGLTDTCKLKLFLDTTLLAQIENQWPDFRKPLIDLFCQENQTLCSAKFLSSLSQWPDWLNKIPIDLLAEWLNKFFANKLLNLANQPSMMDALSKNNVLGERYLDSLGAIIGFDKALFQADQAVQETRAWVDSGVNKGIEGMQKGLETILLDAPIAIGKALIGLFWDGMAQKAGDSIAGACRASTTQKPINSQTDCVFGEIYRLKDGQKECCSIGNALACQDRCRLCGANKDQPCLEKECSKVIGEVWQKNSAGKYACCIKETSGFCQKCRQINLAAGSQCRVENGQAIEELGQVDGYDRCCWKEQYQTPPTDKCCVSVMECVLNKFASHLEVLAEMLANGSLPLTTLRKR